MAKLSTLQHIYIYIYAVKLKTGPRFGGFKVKNWSKFKVKNWSKFFHCFPQFYSVFWAFLETQIVHQCVKIVFLQKKKKNIYIYTYIYVCQALWHGTQKADDHTQTRANADKCEQTQNQEITPPSMHALLRQPKSSRIPCCTVRA